MKVILRTFAAHLDKFDGCTAHVRLIIAGTC